MYCMPYIVESSIGSLSWLASLKVMKLMPCKFAEVASSIRINFPWKLLTALCALSQLNVSAELWLIVFRSPAYACMSKFVSSDYLSLQGQYSSLSPEVTHATKCKQSECIFQNFDLSKNKFKILAIPLLEIFLPKYSLSSLTAHLHVPCWPLKPRSACDRRVY